MLLTHFQHNRWAKTWGTKSYARKEEKVTEDSLICSEKSCAFVYREGMETRITTFFTAPHFLYCQQSSLWCGFMSDINSGLYIFHSLFLFHKGLLFQVLYDAMVSWQLSQLFPFPDYNSMILLLLPALIWSHHGVVLKVSSSCSKTNSARKITDRVTHLWEQVHSGDLACASAWQQVGL